MCIWVYFLLKIDGDERKLNTVNVWDNLQWNAGGVETAAPKEKHRKILHFDTKYNLWAQHYPRIYCLYFSDLGQMRPWSSPTAPSGALCRGFISQVQHSHNVSSLEEWNEAAMPGAPYGKT